MFNPHNFILQNQSEKWLVFTSYGFIIEVSRSEKLQKYRIILSQHTNYLHKWLVHLNFDMFIAAMFICFVRFLNMHKLRAKFCLLRWAGPSGLVFYESGPGRLLSWLGMVNAGWLGSIQMKFIILQGCSTNRFSFYMGSLLHIISSLFNHISFFQNSILHKILQPSFWKFKPIFLRMQVSLVAAFFFSSFSCLFELIFASSWHLEVWYLG